MHYYLILFNNNAFCIIIYTAHHLRRRCIRTALRGILSTTRDPVQVLGNLNGSSAFVGGAIFWRLFAHSSHILSTLRTCCRNLGNLQTQNRDPGISCFSEERPRQHPLAAAQPYSFLQRQLLHDWTSLVIVTCLRTTLSVSDIKTYCTIVTTQLDWTKITTPLDPTLVIVTSLSFVRSLSRRCASSSEIRWSS